MSHGAIHASAEGANDERGVSVTCTAHEPGRCSRRAVACEWDFTAACISLSRRSCKAQATTRDCRTYRAHHIQNPRRYRACITCICDFQRSDTQRSCHPRHQRSPGACAPIWLSGCASTISDSNTASTVYSPPSFNRSTRYSCPTACGRRSMHPR